MSERKGYYADAEGIKPWFESPVQGGLDRYNGQISMRPITPRQGPETVVIELEPLVKRTPQERLADATQRIYDHAQASYREFGRVVFPESIIQDIQQQFWAAGEPITREQIESLVEHEIRPLCERYAAILLNKSHRQYKDNAVLAPNVKG